MTNVPNVALVGLGANAYENTERHVTAEFADYSVSYASTVPTSELMVEEGGLLSFTVIASDPDRPAQGLTFSLGATAPSGASLDPATGRLTWSRVQMLP